MWYLKCTNIPLSVLKDPKHGNGNNMGWLRYGFKTSQLSALTLQFRDQNDDWVQYLPIHNKNSFHSTDVRRTPSAETTQKKTGNTSVFWMRRFVCLPNRSSWAPQGFTRVESPNKPHHPKAERP